MDRWSLVSVIVCLIFLLVRSTITQTQLCEHTSRCLCMINGDDQYDYKCDCPLDEGDCFYVHVKPNEIEFACDKDHSWPSMVNELNVSGSFKYVTIRNCSLPNDTLTHLLEDLGIKNVTSLALRDLQNVSHVFKDGYFDGLSSMWSLFIQRSHINAFPDSFFQGLANLEVLHIDGNELTAVKAKLFEPIPKLRRLDMGRNNLTRLDDGVFEHLPNLKLLNLYANQMSTLTRGVFVGLRSLTSLDVNSNGLSSLADDVFQDLHLLGDLNLSFNNISNFFGSMFANKSVLTKLRVTQASGVNVTGVSTDWFSNMTSLKILNLDWNRFEYLPNGVFRKTDNLTDLTLMGNKLMAMDKHVFEDIPNLRKLDLSHNKLRSLNDTIFKGLVKLIELHLDHNQLHFLNKKVFNSLTALTKLSLQNNQLASMATGVFSSLIKLKDINLANNAVSMYDESTYHSYQSHLSNCLEIENINLRNNTVKRIYDDWQNLFQKLKKLDLSFNWIDELETLDFQFISDRIIVNLTSNRFSNVDLKLAEKIFNANVSSSKVEIILDNNRLRCDCNAYALARYFQQSMNAQVYDYLKLQANNLLCSEPPRLTNLSLTEVNFYDLTCPLNNPDYKKYCPENCDCFYRPVDYAAVFNCSGANVRHLPSPPNSTNLPFTNVELLLDNNRLTSLDMVKPWLIHVKLTKLSLASNRLRNLDGLILPSSLKTLELHGNELPNLDETVIKIFNNSSNLTNITLYENPWKCDCDSKYLLNFLKNPVSQVHLPNNVTCSINGESLSKFSVTDLCGSSSTFMIICVSLASFGMLFGATVAFYHKYEFEIKMRIFTYKILRWLVTEKEIDRNKEYDAFISYSHEDALFVEKKLLPKLESGENPFKVCVHIRDWEVGKFIPLQINHSVNNSRRTIIVLSPNFLKSSWGKLEFKVAYLKALKERCPRMIIIMLEDIGDINNLDDPELKTYLSMNTYLKWGDPWFWQKLNYAMPHPQKYRKQLSISSIKQFMNRSVSIQLNNLNNNETVSHPQHFEPSKEEEKIGADTATKFAV